MSAKTPKNLSFAARLLAWFDTDGRHNLPWQYHHRPHADIYAVWLSEIMLQQTQVSTVLGYFERFMKKFATVEALALADWEEVAQLWAGLGYYARARNLHQGAKQLHHYIQTHHQFPQTVEEWMQIKGVGRSTAGAVVAMGVKGFGVICDGNVKRVLTRHQAIAGDITKAATDKELWALAHELTPKTDSGKYAQAMMDLGATLCTRNKPKCHLCPVRSDCLAYHSQTQHLYPVKAKAKAKPHKHALVLQLRHGKQTLWLQRQSNQQSRIWAGLWCLPMLSLDTDTGHQIPLERLNSLLFSHLNDDAKNAEFETMQLFLWLHNQNLSQDMQPAHNYLKHTFTHFHWHLYLFSLTIDDSTFTTINALLEEMHTHYRWENDDNTLAKPAAMVKLLQQTI